MIAKEYLSQAYKIDNDINSKLEQVAFFRDLAIKATSTRSDMPRSPNRNFLSTSFVLNIEARKNIDTNQV